MEGQLSTTTADSSVMVRPFLPARSEPPLAGGGGASRALDVSALKADEPLDFIGHADALKALFKLPYDETGTTVALHRMGSTLFLHALEEAVARGGSGLGL